jgi:hypothetical protein
MILERMLEAFNIIRGELSIHFNPRPKEKYEESTNFGKPARKWPRSAMLHRPGTLIQVVP